MFVEAQGDGVSFNVADELRRAGDDKRQWKRGNRNSKIAVCIAAAALIVSIINIPVVYSLLQGLWSFILNLF